jgi:hypothetical protein
MQLPRKALLPLGIVLVLTIGILACRPADFTSKTTTRCEFAAAKAIEKSQEYDDPVVEITNIREISRVNGTTNCTGVAQLKSGAIKSSMTYSATNRSLPIPVIWLATAIFWITLNISGSHGFIVAAAVIFVVGAAILSLLGIIVRRAFGLFRGFTKR